MNAEERAFVAFYVSAALALLALIIAMSGCSLLIG
jgi:hypothetical protein